MTKNIVLLHGWGGNKKSLEALDNELKLEGFNTFRLEMPGHGATPEMTKAWAMTDFSNWLRQELQSIKLTAYSLFGHSFGGRIILDTLINNTIKPEAIILPDISGINPKNSFKKSFWKIVSNFSKSLSWIPGYNFCRKLIYKYIIGEEDYLKTNNFLKETFQIINEAYYDDVVEKIKVPTLIIWGTEDHATPLWMGEFLHKKIVNSKLVVLPGTHGLPLKQPKEVSKTINTFITNL